MAQSKGLMRSLGEFVGHIARAVKTDPVAEDRRDEAEAGADAAAGGKSREVRREVEERPGEIDGRKVTLRRTIIEEVRFEGEGDPLR